MPDAWETLIANSSLVSGDAWEHLNAQEGGGTVIQAAETITAQLSSVSASVSVNSLTVTASINKTETTATAQKKSITATIQAINAEGSLNDN